MPEDPQLRDVTHQFPRHRRSPASARRAFREWAAAWRVDGELTDAAKVVLGELAANAVLAATGPGRRIEVRFLLEAGLLALEVSDAGDGVPVIRNVTVWDEHGRGMALVAGLADEWEVRARGGVGKTVRAVFKVGSSRPLTGG